MYCKFLKNVFDVTVASLLLIIFFPLLLFMYVLIYFFLGSPVFFKQTRPGLNAKPFNIYKFRTMLDIKNKNGVLLSDEERLTKFGKLLRSSSLDELPELLNVIKGDMSLVGPRPLLMEYLPYYSKMQQKRHDLKPGMTGWAQINGRNAISWEKKFELDVWYVTHCSFMLDIKILLLTFIKIIKREGINAKDHATMSRFDLESKHKMN